VLAGLLVFVLTSLPGHGQATFGTITGTVRDASGAFVPGAVIEVVNQDTSVKRTAASDQYGNFEVTHLNTGAYMIAVRAAGFKSFVARDISLEALRSVRIDILLDVGDVGTEVSVVAPVPVLETEGSSIADLKTGRQLRDLPLNIRSSQSVAVGGGSGLYSYVSVVPTGYQGGGSRFSLGGGRGSQNYFNVDGISSNSPAFGNAIGSAQPSFESIEELRFDIVNNKAEFSQVANITSITKSGGNRFRGGLLWLQDNSALSARPFFAQDKGRNIFNDFGGSLGGPIRKDKVFFFAAYEGIRQRTPAILAPSVPTARMREGNFADLLSQRQPVLVRDPSTGQPFPGNVVPAGRLSAPALKWQDRFLPRANFGPPDLLSGNFRATAPQQVRHDQFDTRVDYNFSPGNVLYGRFSFKSSNFNLLRSGVPVEFAGYATLERETRQVAVSDTWTITPRWINEFKVGYTYDFNPGSGPLKGQELIDFLGLQGIPRQSPDVPGLPDVSISGFVRLIQPTGQSPEQRTLQLVNQSTWIKGRHTVKAGVDYIPQRYNARNLPSFGGYQFANRFSGFAYSDFLLGLPQATSYSFAPPPRGARFWFLSWFIQEDFKVSSRLTLSYGLRHDYNRPAFDRLDAVANFSPATGGLVVPSEKVLTELVSPFFPRQIPITTAQAAAFPARSLRQDDRNNFQPRFGFAYRPFRNTRTVVRGGYGIFNDNFTADLFAPLYGGPFGASLTFTNAVTTGVPLVTFERPFLDFERGSAGVIDLAAIERGVRNPYVQQWNLTIEQELLRGAGLRFSYIGNRSVDLVYRRNINQPAASTVPFSQGRRPWPLYRNITMADNGGNQIYHGLSVEAQRKWRNGMSFNAAWTWAKNITDVSESSGVEGGAVIENSRNRVIERGNAQFSPRHRLISHWIWELPVGAGKNHLADAGVWTKILGGWQTSAAFIAQTGEYLTPTFSGADPSNTQTLGGVADRIGNGNLPTQERNIDRWFDVTAFRVPSGGGFGNSGRGIILGPGRQTLSLGLFRNFRIRESGRLRFQATFTNALNQPNFENPSMNVSAVGSVATIRTVQIRDFAGPRNGQVGIRYDF